MRLDGLSSRSFLWRYLTLFGGEAVSKTAVLLAFVYLAHVLDPGEYGLIELALSVTVFFVLGAESGMGAYGARIVAAQPDRLPHLVPRIMLLRSALGLFGYALIVAASVIAASPLTRLLVVSGAAVFLTPFLTQWVFQGLRQMHWVAAGSALRSVVFALLVVLLARSGSDLRTIAAAEVAGVAALALCNAWFLFAHLRLRPDFRGLIAGTGEVLRQVWALGLSDVCWASLWYAPAILAGWLSGGSTEQVAWIAAAVRVVLALHTFVWLYFFNLLPGLATELSKGLVAWAGLTRRSLRLAMWPALLTALTGSIAAPTLVPLVFGPAYVAAVLPFQIAVWMIPVAWFSGHFRFSLIAAGQPRAELGALVVGGAFTVLTAAGLQAAGGSVGAAMGLLAGGVANAAAAVWATRRRIGPMPFLQDIVRPLGAAAVAAPVGLIGASWIGALPSAVVVGAIFAGTGAFLHPEIAGPFSERFSRRRADPR